MLSISSVQNVSDTDLELTVRRWLRSFLTLGAVAIGVLIVATAAFQTFRSRQRLDLEVETFVRLHAAEIVSGNWRTTIESIERVFHDEGVRAVQVKWEDATANLDLSRSIRVIQLPSSATPVVRVMYDIPFHIDAESKLWMIAGFALLGFMLLIVWTAQYVVSAKVTDLFRHAVGLAGRLNHPDASVFESHGTTLIPARMFDRAAIAADSFRSWLKLESDTKLRRGLTELHHDLAAPVSALATAIDSLKSEPHDALVLDLLEQAMCRIHGIHTGLAQHYAGEGRQCFALNQVVDFSDQYIALKKAQIRVNGARERDWRFNVQTKQDLTEISIVADGLLSSIGNMLDNAEEATREFGTVVALSLDVDDAHVMLEISDDGVGMSSEKLKDVVSGVASSRHHAGFGLGVRGVYRLADSCGGTVTIQSPADGFGRGTTIRLRLPVAEPNSASQNPLAPCSGTTASTENLHT